MHLGFALYFKDNRNLTIFNIILILATVILIFLTGERAAFFKTVIFIFIIFFLIDLSLKFKIYFVSILLFSIITLISINPVIFDRYYQQTKTQIFGNKELTFLSYYTPMFETSYKMFLDKPLFGHGPKTYRYYCKKENL